MPKENDCVELLYFFHFQGFCYVSCCAKPVISTACVGSCLKRKSLRRSQTSRAGIFQVTISFISEERQVQHFLVIYFTLILVLHVKKKGRGLNLHLVYYCTSKLNLSGKTVLLARPLWVNYYLYSPITQPALSSVSSMQLTMCYTIHYNYNLCIDLFVMIMQWFNDKLKTSQYPEYSCDDNTLVLT